MEDHPSTYETAKIRPHLFGISCRPVDEAIPGWQRHIMAPTMEAAITKVFTLETYRIGDVIVIVEMPYENS